MLNHLKHRGALLIEYALLFALLAIVGFAFMSDGVMTNSIAGIFGKTEKVLDGAKSPESKNTAANFADFCATFREISDQKTLESDAKKTLNTVLDKDHMNNSTEKKFSELSDADKKALEALGLNYQDFANAWFYKDNDAKEGANNGRWYVCWTEEDLSTKKEGDTVKVMTYSASGNTKAGYYVGTTTYKKDSNSGELSITNNQIRYDTRDGVLGMSDSKSGYKHYNTKEEAIAAYNKL